MLSEASGGMSSGFVCFVVALGYVLEDDLELLILQPLCPKFWVHKQVLTLFIVCLFKDRLSSGTGWSSTHLVNAGLECLIFLPPPPNPPPKCCDCRCVPPCLN